MTREQLIDLLNEDLRLEYRSIVQYVHHIASIKGAEYQNIMEELSGHVSQELEHAKVLAAQIDFLGGEPATDVPAVATSKDPRAALKDDLQLEERQLERYRERVDQAAEAGVPDVSEALSPLLQQTQDHVRELRIALGISAAGGQ